MKEEEAKVKMPWGVVIAKGAAAGIILTVWWILFSNYVFIWEANWSFWGLSGSNLAAVALAVSVLCRGTTRCWGWSYFVCVCTFFLFNIIMDFIPDSASLLWGNYEFGAGTRFINQMILSVFLFDYVLIPVIMLYIRLLDRDRRKNAPLDARFPSSRLLWAGKTAMMVLILTAVPLIRFSKRAFLRALMDRCGVWTAPILLSAFTALALPVLLFRGSRCWQSCLLGAEAVSSVIWIVWSVAWNLIHSNMEADPDMSFIYFLSRAEYLVGHVLLISFGMLILRWIIRRRAQTTRVQEL